MADHPQRPQEPASQPDPWHAAVPEACVVRESCYVPDDPRAAIAQLLKWEVDCALYPLVSAPARVLIEQGQALGRRAPPADPQRYDGNATLAEMASTHIRAFHGLMVLARTAPGVDPIYLDHELNVLADIGRACEADLAISKPASEPLSCGCHRCVRALRDPVSGIPVSAPRMILCPKCGNKRCPHASDHDLACTNSNVGGGVNPTPDGGARLS